MWRWVVDTFGGRQRTRLDELARRSYTALTGYVRGLVLVGVADATMIGAGLLDPRRPARRAADAADVPGARSCR